MAGHFELLRVLGTGNFGQAWLAQPKSTDEKLSDQKFVVKQVRLLTLSQKELDQALTEVAVLARCRHTNVIRYREAFVDNGALHIVMEYADGGDLRQKMLQQQGIHFKADVLLDWFIQLCFAVKYIHTQHILHRDLKTQNIFLTRTNVIKLGDFGIARVLQDKDDHAQTTIGTPYYLSPEICQKHAYNHKSDMWALGCVLYEMCSLHVPFDAPNFTVLVTKILQGQYTPIPSHFGPVLEDLVKILLNVDPEKRPSSEQVLCIPAIQPSVQAYLQRQKSLIRPSRSSISGESPPTSKNKIPRFQINSPQTPIISKPSSAKRKESPMIESPTMPTVVQLKESPVAAGRSNSAMQLKESPAATGRSKLSKLGTPVIKKTSLPPQNLLSTPSTPASALGRKKSKPGDKVKTLKHSRITPPGSAEIRRAKLKKLDGATPKISNLVLRQRAVQSANCINALDVVKSPAPKLSLFKHLFQRRAYSVDSAHLLQKGSVVSSLVTSSNSCVSNEDEENTPMSMSLDDLQKLRSGKTMQDEKDSLVQGQAMLESGESVSSLHLGNNPEAAEEPLTPTDDQSMDSLTDPNNNLDKDMTVSSSPKKQMKKMHTYTLLREIEMHGDVIENHCLNEGIPEEDEVPVPEMIKEVACTLYQSACQISGSHFTALETLRCYLETAWGTERFCEVYPKFKEAVRNKIPFSEVSVEMSKAEWCLFPVLQQVYILETFNSEKTAAQ